MTGAARFRVFFCWQSDLTPRLNRNLVRRALDIVTKDFPVELEVEEDARGAFGLAEIPAQLLAKISSSDAFLCDLSIVARRSPGETPGRAFPNPNVMFELGHAVGTLGWTRTVAVFNSAHGHFSDLPFDLGWRTPIEFHAPPDMTDDQVAQVKRALAARLRDHLVIIHALGPQSQVSELDRQVAYRLRDALTAFRFRLHLYCSVAAPGSYYAQLRPLLDAAPLDLPGVPPRPDARELRPLVECLTLPLVLEPPTHPHFPKSDRWIDGILDGLANSISACQSTLDRHSQRADTRLVAALERYASTCRSWLNALRDIASHQTAEFCGPLGASHLTLPLQELQHAERVWRSVLHAPVGKVSNRDDG